LTDSNVQRWLDAKTLDDIGELTAQYIEGGLSFHPLHGNGIDEETIRIKDRLTFFNRNGFVTTQSQPAVPLSEDGHAQRACVEGWASIELAKQLATLGLHTDLLVFVCPAFEDYGCRIPVTLEEFRPYTWFGFNNGAANLEEIEEKFSEGAKWMFCLTWVVTIIDLQWGREYYLWDNVYECLARPLDKPFSVVPWCEELGTDFVY